MSRTLVYQGTTQSFTHRNSNIIHIQFLLFVVIILLFFIIKDNRNKGFQLRSNIEYFNVGCQSPPKVCKDDELNVGGVCLGITNCKCPEDKILFEDTFL